MECILFNFLDTIMTNHFLDVWMLIKCPGRNKIEGFMNEDMSDMPRNHLRASKDVIIGCHHHCEGTTQEEILSSAAACVVLL